jgi:DNA-binding NarL/FixJ family response regulator/pimeloyl-ACP methyl ester carboxylesterase
VHDRLLRDADPRPPRRRRRIIAPRQRIARETRNLVAIWHPSREHGGRVGGLAGEDADLKDEVGSWDLVEHLFDASVSPERLDALIAHWDSQLQRGAPAQAIRLADVAGSGFAREIAGVLQILEQLHAAELRRVNDLLSSMLGAAMVLSADGEVVAANEAAGAVFGLRPGGTLAAMPLEPAAASELAARVAEVAGGGEAVVQLRPPGLDRVVLVHLKALRGEGSRRDVLAITSELAWPEAVSAFLARVFALTPAEVELMRLLAAGGTVGAIAEATGRSQGTVRSQLHAVLQKTGTRSQAEAVRLAMLLLQSVPAEAEPPRPPAAPEPHQRFLRMPDGRRVEVLSLGDPAGRPVIWMQSTHGLCRLPRAAEADLARRRLRVILPFRAGWCGSDPLPKGSDPLELAVADMRVLMSQLRIASAPVVAPGDDIRIALMLAQAEPARVRAVFGYGCGFPILNEAQYRRLFPLSRFLRACARYSPKVLPFLARMMRVTIARYGLERYMRGTLVRSPADARAFDDPEVVAAFVAAAEKLFFRESFSEATFAAEVVRFHSDWPDDLGHVACPVTLIHGEQDCNAPFETALDYCALYPAWRFVAYPDEGQFVAHVRWREVYDLIDGALTPALPAAAERIAPA